MVQLHHHTALDHLVWMPIAKGGGLELDHVLSNWLDSQPSGSVLFLCFGSKGAAQLKEIAIWWVVKNPPNSNTDVKLESLLSEGFMDRTKEKGVVVKFWVPQAVILRHESIGGFVTHCGWKSVLEAVTSGVPMIAWPLYAEQLLNSVVLVQEMKLAVPISGNEQLQGNFVSAEEVEKRVSELMVGSGLGLEGKGLREISLKMKEMAMAAWKSVVDCFFKLGGFFLELGSKNNPIVRSKS